MFLSIDSELAGISEKVSFQFQFCPVCIRPLNQRRLFLREVSKIHSSSRAAGILQIRIIFDGSKQLRLSLQCLAASFIIIQGPGFFLVPGSDGKSGADGRCSHGGAGIENICSIHYFTVSKGNVIHVQAGRLRGSRLGIPDSDFYENIVTAIIHPMVKTGNLPRVLIIHQFAELIALFIGHTVNFIGSVHEPVKICTVHGPLALICSRLTHRA